MDLDWSPHYPELLLAAYSGGGGGGGGGEASFSSMDGAVLLWSLGLPSRYVGGWVDGWVGRWIYSLTYSSIHSLSFPD